MRNKLACVTPQDRGPHTTQPGTAWPRGLKRYWTGNTIETARSGSWARASFQNHRIPPPDPQKPPQSFEGVEKQEHGSLFGTNEMVRHGKMGWGVKKMASEKFFGSILRLFGPIFGLLPSPRLRRFASTPKRIQSTTNQGRCGDSAHPVTYSPSTPGGPHANGSPF